MIIRETDKEFKKLASIRGDIKALREEIKNVESAPLAPDDMRSRIHSMLESQAKRTMPESTIRGFFSTRADRMQPALGALDWGLLVAVLGRETIEQRLADVALDAMKAGGLQHGLPYLDRKNRIHELQIEIQAKEIAEIKEMLRLEDAGFDVLPRPDSNTGLMLQIWGEIGGPADEDLHGAEPAGKPYHVNDGAVLHRTPDSNAPLSLHNGPK